MREAADQAGRGGDPIRKVIAAAAGTWSPAKELLMASEQAQAWAAAHAPNRTTTKGPSNIDANDLYDAASGLYLTMTPRLGIAREAVGVTPESS